MLIVAGSCHNHCRDSVSCPYRKGNYSFRYCILRGYSQHSGLPSESLSHVTIPITTQLYHINSKCQDKAQAFLHFSRCVPCVPSVTRQRMSLCDALILLLPSFDAIIMHSVYVKIVAHFGFFSHNFHICRKKHACTFLMMHFSTVKQCNSESQNQSQYHNVTI